MIVENFRRFEMIGEDLEWLEYLRIFEMIKKYCNLMWLT